MVRILPFTRGLRPRLHSTTDYPYLIILPERAAKIHYFSRTTKPFSKKKQQKSTKSSFLSPTPRQHKKRVLATNIFIRHKNINYIAISKTTLHPNMIKYIMSIFPHIQLFFTYSYNFMVKKVENCEFLLPLYANNCNHNHRPDEYEASKYCQIRYRALCGDDILGVFSECAIHHN